MSEIMQLYQELVLKHARNSPFEMVLSAATQRVQGANPLCGDFITLELRLADLRIVEIGFQGDMSAITRASASLMCGLVSGLSIAEAHTRIQAAFALLNADDSSEYWEILGEFAAMRVLRQYPNRIKTATLPWAALKQALSGTSMLEVSTE